MNDEGRPQDQGRPHRRGGTPSAETTTLLARYQVAMRTELRGILDALAEAAPDGLLLDAPALPKIPLDDPKRDRLWDRAVKLARELGTEVDPGPPPGEAPPLSRRRRARPDFG